MATYLPPPLPGKNTHKKNLMENLRLQILVGRFTPYFMFGYGWSVSQWGELISMFKNTPLNRMSSLVQKKKPQEARWEK